jgi:hypothetical protein
MGTNMYDQAKEDTIPNDYVVDFGSVYIDKATKDKLDTDPEFCKEWVIEHAYIDQILFERVQTEEAKNE